MHTRYAQNLYITGRGPDNREKGNQKMIIDLILDRKADDELRAQGYTHRQKWDGTIEQIQYRANTFYRNVFSYSYLTDHAEHITRAMDAGTEDDVRRELCRYITENEYNPEICRYINNRKWLIDC